MKPLFATIAIILGGTLLSANCHAVENAGKTIMARGGVVAVDSDSNESRSLRRRSPISSVDRVVTQDNGRAQFSMVDGGLLSVKPNSEVNISSYQYNADTQEGSAVIELVKGGLRSISGQIKKYGGDYEVKTPVGSIGIRGTHFEIEVIDGDMLVAVWDGAVDVTLPGSSAAVSFGAGEDYSYAVISNDGEVTPLLEAPSAFTSAATSGDVSTDGNDNSNDDTASDTSTDASTTDAVDTNTVGDVDIANVSTLSNEGIDASLETVQTEEQDTGASVFNEQTYLVSSQTDLADIISSRSGEFSYQSVVLADVSSNDGVVSDFNVNMTVDFDNGVVKNGELVATDAGGEWYAAFAGLIDVTDLDLAVTFAAHGNNAADGTINATFTDESDSITGAFELIERISPSNKLTGSFIVE